MTDLYGKSVDRICQYAFLVGKISGTVRRYELGLTTDAAAELAEVRRLLDEFDRGQAQYCATCDIEHDRPEQCPEHPDYEPVQGLDRYPDVKVSDLADND